jgi:sialidase-1
VGRVHEDGGDAPITIGNPCPIVAHDRDRVHLLFTRDNKRLFVTHSDDDGISWAAPQEITEILKDVDFPWLRVASGPVHGIQLHNGLLVAPLWYCDSEASAAEKRYRAGVVFGDGEIWKAGGLVPESIPGLNECTVLERRDRSLLLNMRAYKTGYRAVSESRDGGQSWTNPVLDTRLPDPTCQGSLLRLSSGDVAFANIPAETRTHLTVRHSRDDGESWAHARLLEAGPSAYSDLAQRADGVILCLYERGTERYNERITAASFGQEWLVAPDTGSPEL